MAARLEYPRSKKPFRSYALLGDDIVISDERVALRLCGAGYRVRSRLAKPSKKQKDGKGCLIVEKVLSRMKPKQLELVPDEYWFSWVPTWKSIPNDDGQFAGRKAVPKILTNMRSFAFDIRVIHGFQDGVFSPAVDLKDGPWTASILHGRPMVLRILCGTDDVSISEAKSLQSKTGALEFAKQLWVDRVQVNLTPVSAKALLGATTLIGLCQLAEKYGLSRTSLFSLAGAGYRVRARLLSHHLSRRWKRLRADKSLTYLRLPLDLWLNPTNPYLKGIIVEKVRRVSQAIGLIPR
ncbi:hypothetical protein ZIOFF_074473 (mitochondrion) [Zingiber officinale]|uniref:Uncharacterized protein n=1 Tax=Zingiber officinale TaxID=94328 RepID=A0A8J5C5X7_ZINOF|nr:hypothetical protein ZIOFF_074473 [Zingiber officinale]